MKITLAKPLAVSELALMAGGCLCAADNPHHTVTHICTDSREADAHTLFCAIRGERVDGHAYVSKAAELGCRAFLCERIPENLPDEAACIVVEDTVNALSSLASSRRGGDLGALTAVAVTGSVGKTTTKEMIAAVLAAGKTIFKKEGNYNSTIGLPLSVMEITPSVDTAVLEMGMSGRGEILSMTRGVRPDIAVITNIGSSHMELLGSRENIARAKLEIAAGLREGGVLLLNGDEPLLRDPRGLADDMSPAIPEGISVRYLSLAGDSDADYAVSGITSADGGSYFNLITPTEAWTRLFVPAVGEHMVWAGAFAAVVGSLCGLTEGQVRAGLAAYRPAKLRQSARDVEGITLIEDCYNAAPESMAAALRVLELTAETKQAPRGRRIAVLGDMKELGENTVTLHRGVGATAARMGVDLLVTVGELGAHIAEGALEAGMSPDAVIRTGEVNTYPDTARRLAALLAVGDTVLFKASRAMTLEVLAEALSAELSAEKHDVQK